MRKKITVMADFLAAELASLPMLSGNSFSVRDNSKILPVRLYLYIYIYIFVQELTMVDKPNRGMSTHQRYS